MRLACWLFMILLPMCIHAQESAEDTYAFLSGTYSIVGRMPDSVKSYSGKVVASNEGDHLKLVRQIGKKTVSGSARIDYVTADRIRILRTVFIQGGREIEGVFLIHSDLDNYARLTGQLMAKDAMKPGIEAWFIDHSE